jgi:hypothetical protein
MVLFVIAAVGVAFAIVLMIFCLRLIVMFFEAVWEGGFWYGSLFLLVIFLIGLFIYEACFAPR